MKTVFVLLIILVIHSNATNTCSNLKTENLQIPKYTGRWFEIGVGGFQRNFQRNFVCTRAEYSVKNEINRTVKVVNSCNIGVPQGNFTQIVGEAVQRNITEPGKLMVTFGSGFYSPYWVMETDYSNFALIYSCSVVNGRKLESAWILSRKPEMDEGVAKELEKKLREKTGFKDEIPRTLQKGCSY
jgi:apolipoprotein D and lipocalin family protein